MKPNITIRQQTSADHQAIYALIKTAFETAEHRDGTEQDFAVSLRNSLNYLPQLDLLAELNGEIVGHIMVTKTSLTKPDGTTHETLLVAPLSVLIEHRKSGVGSALMNEALRLAATMGYTTAFLIGDPNYYRRFGFKLAHLFAIRHATMPAEYVMVKELTANALNGITGEIHM